MEHVNKFLLIWFQKLSTKMIREMQICATVFFCRGIVMLQMCYNTNIRCVKQMETARAWTCILRVVEPNQLTTPNSYTTTLYVHTTNHRKFCTIFIKFRSTKIGSAKNTQKVPSKLVWSTRCMCFANKDVCQFHKGARLWIFTTGTFQYTKK